MSFPFYKQFDVMDCGPTCLRIIAKYYGKSYSLQYLRERCLLQRDGVSLLGISQAAEYIGLRSVAAKLDYETLQKDVPMPCIVHWEQSHFIVVYRVNKALVWIADPGKSKFKLKRKDFEQGWLVSKQNNRLFGIALLLFPTETFFEINSDVKGKESRFLKILYRFKKHRKLFLQVLLGILLGVILQVILPFLSQSVVDIGIKNNDIHFITLVLIGQIVILLGSLMIDFTKSWTLLFISTRVNIEMLTEFFIKLMKLRMSYFDIKMTGDIMQRMSDHTRLQSFVTNALLNASFAIINFVVFTFITIAYDLNLFIIFLAWSLVYFGWISLFFRERRKLDYAHFELSAKNQNAVLEIVQGMQEIKLNNCEKKRRWQWEFLQAKLFKQKMQSLVVNQFQIGGAQFINHSKNVFITFWVAKEVINGNITLGGMIAIQYIIGQLNGPLLELVQFFQSFQDAKLSFDRIEEIQQHEVEESIDKEFTHTLPSNHSIQIINLSYKYTGYENDFALRNINVVLLQGKTTAIVGTSGSGKTTLIKLLLQFYDTTEGEIRIDNKRLKDISPSFWRSKCGVVTQDGYIFSDTIEGNIAVGDDNPDPIRLSNALLMANLMEFVDMQPLGLNTKIGAQGNGISEGQKQRLLIARAIYKSPEYIFFDEATNALDAKNERIIMNNLQKYFKGKTAIVVAHRLSTVKHADQIIVLEKGEVVEIGTHSELTRKKQHYFELIKNQLELGI